MLWGGRFEKGLDASALQFSTSLGFDINMLIEDLTVSKVHAEMLANINIITVEESKKIIAGLSQIEEEWNDGKWHPDESKFEDVHSAIESRLYEIAGDVAGKLHSGRSRNDLVATDFRMWVKNATISIIEKLTKLQKAMITIAKDHTETIMPGYTHLQRAQPVSFAFHLLAYVEMFERDKNRLIFILDECDVSPLGAGALAGSTLPLDREFTSKKLGFKRPSSNALDSVSDRDFAADFLNACNIGMMHLSKISEEFVIWSSAEWGFIKIGDDFTTGSSLMPQKKNPDMAELTRGKTGRVYGNYTNLMTMLKGLPLSYNRDMQEDKEPLFDSTYQFSNCLNIVTGMIKTVTVDVEKYEEKLNGDFMLATDLADWLVIKKIPFREAHHIVGQVVKLAETQNKKLNELSIEELKSINSIFEDEVFEVFNIKEALNRKVTYGSPNPKLVLEQIIEWNNKLK